MFFAGVELAQGREWFEAAKTGSLVVTAAQRNGGVAILTATMEVLADPATLLPPSADQPLRLPVVPYTGPDSSIRGRNVPVLGAIEAPAWWRSGGDAPASLPAWVRSTDRERRALWGACASVLERLAETGDRSPQEGRSARASGWLPAVLGAVAIASPLALAALYLHERAETERVRLAEEAATHRFAEQCATATKLYVERLKVFRDTGRMPDASPAEGTANPTVTPANGRPVPAPGSPSGVGETWWSSVGTTAAKVGAVTLAATVLVGLAAYGWRQAQRRVPAWMEWKQRRGLGPQPEGEVA